MPRLRPAALVLGVAGSCAIGCYRHVPVDPAPLTPGAAVRVYLTPDGTARLAARLGENTVAVEGRVDSVVTDGLALSVSRTTKSFGGTVTWIGEHVTIPTAAVARAERRVVDHRRSTAVAAAAVLAAGAAIVALVTQGGTGSGDGGPPGTVNP